MKLVIGCPVFRRAWIMADWIDYVDAATAFLAERPMFVFVGDPVYDEATFSVIRKTLDRTRHECVIVTEGEDGSHDGSRDWTPARYGRMVVLRNRLLGAVRGLSPDYFLSLDSDILLHPEALEAMIMASQDRGWAGVGSRTYMGPGRRWSSYAMVPRGGGSLRRPDSEGTFRVDVIMAIKLMTPQAYAVDYHSSWRGEDIGWSLACREQGVQLGWVGKYCSKHVMSEESLRTIDARCGY
jgi:hypothetical protein